MVDSLSELMAHLPEIVELPQALVQLRKCQMLQRLNLVVVPLELPALQS